MRLELLVLGRNMIDIKKKIAAIFKTKKLAMKIKEKVFTCSFLLLHLCLFNWGYL